MTTRRNALAQDTALDDLERRVTRVEDSVRTLFLRTDSIVVNRGPYGTGTELHQREILVRLANELLTVSPARGSTISIKKPQPRKWWKFWV